MTFTSCVSDCPSAHPSYVNNPFYGVCESCGPDCAKCTYSEGCTACYSDTSGYRLAFSDSLTKPTPYFKVCKSNFLN